MRFATIVSALHILTSSPRSLRVVFRVLRPELTYIVLTYRFLPPLAVFFSAYQLHVVHDRSETD